VSEKINFLQDFCDLDEFAVDIKRHARTVQRWIERDGLPCAWLGHKRFIHIPTAREWLLSRVRQSPPQHRTSKDVAA
jgi:hypothetical protein